MKSNYYARTLGYDHAVHAFASRKERDSWVEDNWRDRIEISAREAKGTSRAFGVVILHPGADIPESWSTQARTWWVDQLDHGFARVSII